MTLWNQEIEKSMFWKELSAQFSVVVLQYIDSIRKLNAIANERYDIASLLGKDGWVCPLGMIFSMNAVENLAKITHQKPANYSHLQKQALH